MRTFLAIDVETTGLSPETDKILEVGFAAFDIGLKKVIGIGTKFVNRKFDFDTETDGREKISDEIHNLTSIEPEWITAFGEGGDAVARFLDDITIGPSGHSRLIGGVEAIVAHNAPFDRAFLAAMGWETDLPWIDTQLDLPGNVGNKKLQYLALDRGVLSFFPHRAVFDAVQTGQILTTFDFDEVLARAKSPLVVLAAEVSFKENDKAKRLGYMWERPLRHNDLRIRKSWVKGLKALDVRAEQVLAGEKGVMTRIVPESEYTHNSNGGDK